jgi:hypothetical protein
MLTPSPTLASDAPVRRLVAMLGRAVLCYRGRGGGGTGGESVALGEPAGGVACCACCLTARGLRGDLPGGEGLELLAAFRRRVLHPPGVVAPSQTTRRRHSILCVLRISCALLTGEGAEGTAADEPEHGNAESLHLGRFCA